MNSVDISPLVKGILVLIGIAIATGHYGELERWARHQAIEALEWKEPLPYFFPQEAAKMQFVPPTATKSPKRTLKH